MKIPGYQKVVIVVVVVLATLAIVLDSKGSPSSTALASWYGPGLYGNHLACGGTMNPGTWGVANRTLPCGTKITVCLASRCAAVSVIDRGPYSGSREFDLTAAVASYIGFHGVRNIVWWRR